MHTHKQTQTRIGKESNSIQFHNDEKLPFKLDDNWEKKIWNNTKQMEKKTEKSLNQCNNKKKIAEWETWKFSNVKCLMLKN